MRRFISLLFVLLFASLSVSAAGASSVCPSSLDAATCQAFQTAVANLPKLQSFDVSYQLGVSKIASDKTTGLAAGGIGFFDLAITGKQQRQGYLSMEFDTIGTDKPRKSNVEFHLIDGQWYIKMADKTNPSRFKPTPTTPGDYQKFLMLALTNGVKDVQAGQFDHPIDGQTITAVAFNYDAPTLLKALLTGPGRDLIKKALGSEFVPDLDTGLDRLAAALGPNDVLQVAYLIGPDQMFHGMVITVKHNTSGTNLTLRFTLELSQIGAPFKFNEPGSAK